MKVIHLATSLTNGAGKAARRINESINLVGIDSTLVSSGRVDGELSEHESRLKPPTITGLLSKAVTIFQGAIIESETFPMTPISIQNINIQNMNLFKYDVVNLHATYNLASFKSLAYLLENTKNLVLTLHDERFYTGGCHNTLGCTQYTKFCNKCPSATLIGNLFVKKAFELETKVLQESKKRVSLIAPSQWIKRQAEASSKLKNVTIATIPNPIPGSIYTQEEIQKNNSKSGSKVTLGFVAANLDNSFKGLSILMSALERMPSFERGNYRIFLVGNRPRIEINCPIEVTYMQFIGDSEIAGVLRAIDLLIVPSLGDNSPSVISEALMCGTKVIGSTRGGIPEMLDFDPSLIFDVESPQSILEKIREHSKEYDGTKISIAAHKKYSYHTIGLTYKNYYEGLIV